MHCGVVVLDGYRSEQFLGHRFCRATCVDAWARTEVVRQRSWLSQISLLSRGVGRVWASLALYTSKMASRTGGG